MDEEKPPVRRLTLKPKEIIPTETAARPGDGTAISVQLMHRENKQADDKRAGIAPDPGSPHPGSPHPGSTPQAAAPPVPRLPEEPASEAAQEISGDGVIDVSDMLRANQLAANDREGLIAMPKPRRSRRRQDLMLILGLGASATVVLMVVFRSDAQIIGLGMFAIVFLTVILAWVMFGIMDKY
jgi:hypothetical protein